MTQTIHPDNTTEIVRHLYEPITEEMGEVEQILRRELRNPHPVVDELVRYGCLLGGKRLRPALLLLSAKAVGAVRRDHLVLAAVIEMIHTATLVHDDVLDDADTRRHLATANSRWGNQTSVLLGDYLFTHAFYLASTLDSALACRLIGQATNTVCDGELRQIASCGNFALSESDYLQIIDAKTAELCACSCRLGAHFAGATAQTEQRMASFGRNLGIAFQIADDLLDVLGDEATAGKSLGTDLEQQKPTLPLIHVLQRANNQQRDELLAVLGGDAESRQHALPQWYERFEAIEYSQAKARAFAEQARADIQTLPNTPSAAVLKMLTEFVVSRSH